MINKRLLVKNLLAHNDENSFYDKKRFVNIGEKEGKAKFLKHVCALANSNPVNNSFIVVGVEDEDNEIVGTDFFDDSKIQNLVNAYLDHAPLISYENVPFPHLPEGKVVGLVTIRSTGKLCSLRRNIWKYYGGSVFFREGSMSMPRVFDTELRDTNSAVVAEIELHAQNNIELTLNGVIDFLYHRHRDLEGHYKVFKEQFVVCWAGIVKKVNGNRNGGEEKTYYSRVDIELINEQVRLFYSALDEVEIRVNEHVFSTTEFIQLGLNDHQKYYPLETVTITFNDNGSYKIDSTLIFDPPEYDRKVLYHVYNTNNVLLQKLKKGVPLTVREQKDMENLPATYLICALNGFDDAREKLEQYREVVKAYDRKVYASLKESLRVLRKVKYN
ncbi:ATP-binding protein [Sinomicrobium soli]|uniref:ATP-binding protein n=1 Tax=Sinomicrobium sp. N-1-3-6 TaxID=2219864 RepID=UPI000DCD9EF3|nr:ATP-binding protein [Sinomicrobium sp. N-1-3-6]RAV29454.1 ATP-binding protein [Sinomicrobium sp. N-1-3-6]